MLYVCPILREASRVTGHVHQKPRCELEASRSLDSHDRGTDLCRLYIQVKKVEDVVYDLSLRGLLPKEQNDTQGAERGGESVSTPTAAAGPASDVEMKA